MTNYFPKTQPGVPIPRIKTVAGPRWAKRLLSMPVGDKFDVTDAEDNKREATLILQTAKRLGIRVTTRTGENGVLSVWRVK